MEKFININLTFLTIDLGVILMRYLGIDSVGGPISIGVFDSSKKKIILKKFYAGDKVISNFYYHLYQKKQSKLIYLLIKYYIRHLLKKLLSSVEKGKIDYVVLSSYSGSSTLLSNLPYLRKSFSKKKILESDHNWGHINSNKYHKDFKYPALVVDSSARHSVIAYLPNEKKIKIISESKADSKGNCDGLGVLTIDVWVDKLNENVYWWPNSKENRNKKFVYQLYLDRGSRGKIVVRMKKELKSSKLPLCEDVFYKHFPEKMDKLKSAYASLEEFKDDWVASQQQLLRDLMTHIKNKTSKKYPAKSYFISGGISRNPAFKNFKGWLKVPDIVAGDDGAGCFMAFLGYCVNEKGLEVQHDRWKSYRYI